MVIDMTTGQRESTRLDHQARILRLLVHLQEHLDELLTLESLAKVACMSPFHFHRVFRGMLGETVIEHVRRLRIERAAHRLKHGNDTVVRLAFDAGYESHEAFTRAFTRHFGESPSRYRALRKEMTWPAAPNTVHFKAQGLLSRFDPVVSGTNDMKVRIEKRPRTRVAFVRNVGPYEGSRQAWETLVSWVRKRGIFGPSTQMFGLSHDDPDVTDPARVRYDACIAVTDDVEAEGEIGIQELPGGEFAVTMHEGSYDELGKTYAAVFGQWIPNNGYRAGDPPTLERYLNHPGATAEADLRTELWVRVDRD